MARLILDLVAVRMIEPDAEHVGVGELVHAVVELAEDRLEVERRGDLAPISLSSSTFFLPSLSVCASDSAASARSLASANCARWRSLATTRSGAARDASAEDQSPHERDVAEHTPTTSGTTAAGS